MGADMLLRDLYLPAGTGIDLDAAKAAAGQLCRYATIADLRILLSRDWIYHAELYGSDLSDERIARYAAALRPTAVQALYRLLGTFAASLSNRDVARFRFDRADSAAGVDAYITGGAVNDCSPTDSYDAWSIVYDTDAFPDGWCDRLAGAAGLLHPTAPGRPAITVTFHAWA